MRFDNMKMLDHIKNHNPNCSVCEGTEWIIDDTTVDITYHNTGLSQATMRVVCTCANCGNTLFFDPFKAGAISKED